MSATEPPADGGHVDQTPDGTGGDTSLEDSWASLTQSLAAGLTLMKDDQFLILNVSNVADAAGEPPNYYVQFACGGDKGFRAEAVSNRYLADRWKLTEKGSELLFQLGWLAPDPAGEPAGKVNYYRDWPGPPPVAEIAQLAVSTLRRVYDVRSMAQLQYRYFDKAGAQLELADLGLRREASQKDGSDALFEKLRPLVEEALRQALGVKELKYDDAGDIPIRFGNSMVFVRLLGDPPRVRVFSPMLWELRTTEGLYEALNDINARIESGRVFWTGNEVIAAIDLPARGLTGEYVALTCFQMGALADHFDDELAARFGGRTMFQEAAAAGEADQSHKPDTTHVPGYL
jgi:hypothetical protein